MYVVYVIRSIEGLIYTGSTEDFQKRLFQHNNKLAGWTKRGNNWKPFILEYYTKVKINMVQLLHLD